MRRRATAFTNKKGSAPSSAAGGPPAVVMHRLASVISLLQSHPDREDEGYDNAQQHPRISGPFHFFARISSRACRNFNSASASRQNLSSFTNTNGLPAGADANLFFRNAVHITAYLTDDRKANLYFAMSKAPRE